MKTTLPYRIKTITEYHRLLGLPKPEHPLISVIDVASFKPVALDEPINIIFDFYSISLKRDLNATIKYGHQTCDFDEGVLFCMSPGQVWGLQPDKEATKTPSGWMILIHPDFLWSTPLAKSIRQYEYFSYSANEALYLSDKEESMLTGIARYIEQEYHSNIDKFSQKVIIAQLEVILNYADRFYQRQFITRKISSDQTVSRVDDILTQYFNSDALATKGLPTVAYVAEQVNLSAGYLGELLKALTGQNTQQHIHDKLIEKAKEKLSTTLLSVSEIAYELGFEHPQSFNKLFKAKTKIKPLQFRKSFN
jgi:AraC-like DNA-binding protein